MSTLSPFTPPGMPIPVDAANPLLSNRGPASWADRPDHPDYTVHGTPKVIPLRAAPGFFLDPRDPDPRGWEVAGADGVVAGTVAEVWVDASEPMVRYYEVAVIANGRRVLLPQGFAKMRVRRRRLDVKAVYARHFADVPGTRNPDSVTLLEEDKIGAYFAGGLLWADANRAEPLL